jgi:uncharacterized membrane protein YvlD (DUF360 family)
MTFSRFLRLCHRWLGLLFTLIVVAIFGVLGAGIEPVQWVYYLPLLPLALMTLSGLYMFFEPYIRRNPKTVRE